MNPLEGHDRLFAYGTLQLPAIMRALCGPAPDSASLASPEPAALVKSLDWAWTGAAAKLDGFARCRVRGERYPGIRPQARASTAGCVYTGLTAEHWRVLDLFEGPLYERQRVQVELRQPHPVTDAPRFPRSAAFAYVVRSEFMGTLEDREWELEHFAATHLAEYVHSCQRLRLELLADP